MDIFGFDSASFLSFLLTFMRLSLIVFMLPFFGGENIPAQVKASICLVLTLAIWPNIALRGELFPADPILLAIMLGGEVVLGMMLGMMVNFIFAGIQTGGQIIGFQMGFSMISLADPASGAQLVVTSFLSQMIAMVVFLTLDGHLFLLSSLTSSFTLVPPGQLLISGKVLADMITLSADMFVIALKVAGPIVACLFMVDLALALMARAAPQMNLLTLGFPIKIGVGFFFMSIMFSLIALQMEELVRGVGGMFNNVFKVIGAGG